MACQESVAHLTRIGNAATPRNTSSFEGSFSPVAPVTTSRNLSKSARASATVLPLIAWVIIEALAFEIAFAAATRLYEQGRMSLAKAADLAGMDRFGFASRLAELGVATATFEPGDVETAAEAAR